MRALDPEVVDAVWAAVKPLIPNPATRHPLGCCRQRIDDFICFRGMLIRLVTGCSWVDVESLLGGVVSDTTLRTRRDEWVAAGVFDAIHEESVAAYDRVIGLDFSDVAADGSAHKSPVNGEGIGPNPTDRAKNGWKWSILTDANGIPFAMSTDGANRHDSVLFAPMLDDARKRGLLLDVGTIHLDRGYDSAVIVAQLASVGITDAIIAKKRNRGTAKAPTKVPMGMRWPVERTNSWLSNFGQLRRSTDRKIAHRLAQLAFAIVLLLTAKLIDWRNRWSPDCAPIR